MNVSIYTFGEFASGYSQYPSDYTTDIFKEFYRKAKARTQLCIHRDGDIIYYAYIRKLDGSKYIGVCAVINGLMLTNVSSVFTLFEQIYAGMIARGELIMFDNQGNITTDVTQLYYMRESVEQLHNALRVQLDKQQTWALPPMTFSVAKDSVKNFTIEDNNQDIIDASSKYGYTYIYKDKGYDTIQTNSYKGVIARLGKEKKELQERCNDLSSKLSAERRKQQNMKWVSILGFIAIIFGAILWNKVLFPSEVTKKDMGEFVYYGPMANGEPNGTGVAIYHDNDKDGRLYYYGNFTDGKRIDDNAIMFYKDGSYFNGSMNEDKWFQGIFFDVEKEHFIGEFNDNEPWTGDWYKHVKVQTINEGKR